MVIGFVLGTLVACSGSHPSSYGVTVTVINRASHQISFTWRSPGPLGDRFLEQAGLNQWGRAEYITVFEPGVHTIAIDTGAMNRTFDLAAPSDSKTALHVVVQQDGTISEVDSASLPPSPYCT